MEKGMYQFSDTQKLPRSGRAFFAKGPVSLLRRRPFMGTAVNAVSHIFLFLANGPVKCASLYFLRYTTVRGVEFSHGFLFLANGPVMGVFCPYVAKSDIKLKTNFKNSRKKVFFILFFFAKKR
jgi:hypothetical protein